MIRTAIARARYWALVRVCRVCRECDSLPYGSWRRCLHAHGWLVRHVLRIPSAGPGKRASDHLRA